MQNRFLPTSTETSIKALGKVKGLLDTSVVIDLDLLTPQHLPEESAISAITLAVLAAGPQATTDERERSK